MYRAVHVIYVATRGYLMYLYNHFCGDTSFQTILPHTDMYLPGRAELDRLETFDLHVVITKKNNCWRDTWRMYSLIQL
jgi:hypothetical protein